MDHVLCDSETGHLNLSSCYICAGVVISESKTCISCFNITFISIAQNNCLLVRCHVKVKKKNAFLLRGEITQLRNETPYGLVSVFDRCDSDKHFYIRCECHGFESPSSHLSF